MATTTRTKTSAAALMLLALAGCRGTEPGGAELTAGSAPAERLVVVANGEAVGHLHAEQEANRVHIDWFVDDNGRGPKIVETIVLDDSGYPRHWEITGTSLFGAAVAERYAWEDGRAEWTSQADAGSVDAPRPVLYIGNDASPWSLSLYARALLAQPARTLDVLPTGRLELEALESMTVGSGTAVTLYALTGIGLSPSLFALDADGRLFARLGGRSVVIREGYEAEAPRLQARARELEIERMRHLQARLAHRYPHPVRIDDVHLFDPHSLARGEAVSVLVREGRIAAIEAPLGDRDPEGETVVNGEGGTLVPGLWDMHAHNSMQSGLFYLAAGVTSTRDMGNDDTLLPGLRKDFDDGVLAGPRITPAGLIEARSPYSARIGTVADSLEEALAAVDRYAAEGYVEIKTYNSMNPEWVRPIVERAQERGLGISGHVPAFVSPDEVITAGYDSIAHINQLMLGWLLAPGEDTRTPLRLTGMKRAVDLDPASEKVRRTIALMREHGTAQDTTAVILERLMKSRAGEVQPGDVPYLDHMPVGYQRNRKRSFVPLAEPGDDAAYDAAFEKILEVIGLLHENGVPLLVGTDDGTGFTVHRELELYVEAGISPAETLALATLGSARYLGQEGELGSIEPGKLADFILVPGDPTEDIGLVRRIALVSRGGVLYFPEEIYEALGIRPFASKASMRFPGEARD